MTNEIEARLELAETEKEGGAGAIDIGIRNASLTAHEVEIADIIRFEEFRLDCQGVSVGLGKSGPVRIAEANARLVISEASLNRFLALKPDEGVNNLQVAILNGKLRVSGRYM